MQSKLSQTIEIQQARRKKFSIPNHNARNSAFKKPMTIVLSFTNELPVTSSRQIKGKQKGPGKSARAKKLECRRDTERESTFDADDLEARV